MLLDVSSVFAETDHKLLLSFENGETRRFDMSPYLDRRPWVKLKESGLFAQARVAHGTVVWPGGIDIAPEPLYRDSVPVHI